MNKTKLILIFLFVCKSSLYSMGNNIFDAHNIELTTDARSMKSQLVKKHCNSLLILACKLYGFYHDWRPKINELALNEAQRAISEGAQIDHIYKWDAGREGYRMELPLHIACAGQHAKLVDLLLINGASPNTKINNNTPLSEIIKSCHSRYDYEDHLAIIKSLIEHNVLITQHEIDLEEKNLNEETQFRSYLLSENHGYLDLDAIYHTQKNIKYLQESLKLLKNTFAKSTK